MKFLHNNIIQLMLVHTPLHYAKLCIINVLISNTGVADIVISRVLSL